MSSSKIVILHYIVTIRLMIVAEWECVEVLRLFSTSSGDHTEALSYTAECYFIPIGTWLSQYLSLCCYWLTINH